MEIKGLVKNVLSVNNLSKVNFNNIDLIIEYTLSDWKLDNKNIVDLYDNNLSFGVACVIIDWLKESNLIQENLVVIGRKERRTYIIPSDNLIKILKQNNVKSVTSLPLRIPMIVKPKKYSREILDDVVKERLGGYLIWCLVTINLVYQALDKENSKENTLYFIISDEAKSILMKNNIKIYHLPQRLPTVCNVIWWNIIIKNKGNTAKCPPT